jgi:putative Mg2+ transporter-C (MgtC) family protein
MSDIEIVYRLAAAALLGGLIGAERDFRGKVAGFRTYTLVSLGSALFMLVSVHIFEIYAGVAEVDPGRIAAQAVTGVGFLGAGAILRSPTGPRGLTTAAGIWVVAAVGLACGIGFFRAAVIATIITLVVLFVFARLGKKMGAKDV